jgi:hypothetical protein
LPQAAELDDDGDAVHMQQHRNPFIFRTMLANPLHLLTHSRDNSHQAQQPQMSLSDIAPATSRHQHSGSDTKDLVGSGVDSRDGSDVLPWAAVDSGAAAGSRGSKGTAKVQTRVWSDDEDRQRAAAAGERRTAEDPDAEGSEIGLAVSGGARGVRVETRIARSERKL